MFFRSRRMDYHQTLIDHMTAAHYQDVAAGVCFGVSGMGLQAILLRDTKTFDKRITDLCYSHIVVSSDEVVYPIGNTLSYNAFMDGVAAYQSPEVHRQFFKPTIQAKNQDIMISAPVVLPDALENQGGIASAGNFCGAYTHRELYKTLKSLRSHLSGKKLEFPIGFVLSNNNHAFTIGFDPELSKWILIEANNGPSKLLSDYDAAGKIINLLSKNGTAIFDTKIYTGGKNRQLAALAINEWQQSPDYLAQHVITLKHTRALNSDGASLLYIAAQNGRVDIVKKLVANGIDVNQANCNTPTALYIAAHHGHYNVVKELLNSGASLKADYYTGVSPLVAAAKNRHIEIVKLLRDHGANLFEIVKDREVMKLLQKSRDAEREKKQTPALT